LVFGANQTVTQLRILDKDDCSHFPLTPFECDRISATRNNRRKV